MALQKTNFKIRDLCRTCLSKEIEMLSVFEIRLGTLTLDNIITSITGIKVIIILYLEKYYAIFLKIF